MSDKEPKDDLITRLTLMGMWQPDKEHWMYKTCRDAITRIEDLEAPAIKDHNITEIIPSDMPEWARTAMKEGRFFSVALGMVAGFEEEVVECMDCGKSSHRAEYYEKNKAPE